LYFFSIQYFFSPFCVKCMLRLTFVLCKVLYVWQTLSIQMLVKSVKKHEKRQKWRNVEIDGKGRRMLFSLYGQTLLNVLEKSNQYFAQKLFVWIFVRLFVKYKWKWCENSYHILFWLQTNRLLRNTDIVIPYYMIFDTKLFMQYYSQYN